MTSTIIVSNEAETSSFAAQIAQQANPGDVILLEGELGMGKTAFARGFIQSITHNNSEEVPSPTYNLLQTYDSPKGPVWHFDLYRLRSPDEIYELGWEDCLGSGILLIEWPENLGTHRPKDCITIHIEAIPNKPASRNITFTDQRVKR